jgi:hypothetical protein
MAVPDRWVVIRFIHQSTHASGSEPGQQGPEFSAFVVESNRVRRLDRDEFQHLDLDTEAAPFFDCTSTPDTQQGVFLGAKYRLEDWDGVYDPAAQDPDSFHMPLTVADGANTLFTDFQHHNMNVFSMHDDMTYYDMKENRLRTLETAEVSYYVVGFHGLPQYDPLANGIAATYADVLKSHSMSLETDLPQWLKRKPTRHGIRSVCQGAAYHIRWSLQNPPTKVPADEIAEKFAALHPVAVGTDLINALKASFQAPSDPSKADPGLAAALKHLEILAENPDDNGDGSSQTAQTQSKRFKPKHGGHSWHIKGTDESTAESTSTPAPNDASIQEVISPSRSTVKPSKLDMPSADALRMVHRLNTTQRLYDTSMRHYHLLQHLFFCEWWKARAAGYGDPGANVEDGTVDDGFDSMHKWYRENLVETRRRTRDIVSQLIKLKPSSDPAQGFMAQLNTHMDDLMKQKDAPSCEKTAEARYYSAKDPTILLSEVESSWPDDFTDEISVKLNTQLPLSSPIESAQEDALEIFKDHLTNLPPWVHGCIEDLLKWWLSTEESAQTNAKAVDEQAWFPLFIEWEADYFHIPYKNWILRDTNTGSVKYEIKHSVDLSRLPVFKHGRRGLSGRSTVLPESSRALSTLIDTVFSRSNQEDLRKIIGEEDQESLKDAFATLNHIVSAQLDGIGDHLLTLARGTHPVPLPASPKTQYEWIRTLFPRLDPSDHSTLMSHLQDGNGADITPYSQLPVQGVSRTNASGPLRLFHPVTHGQIRFTKLNLIDKFGQVVCAFDPRPGQPFRPVYPSVSEDLACQRNALDGKIFANTVDSEPEGRCQFFQLGPRINQDARYNIVFVTREERTDESDSSENWYQEIWKQTASKATVLPQWRSMTEWENPIWGWIICNFQDDSLQVFEGDGTLCGEILVGASTKGFWLNPGATHGDDVPVVKNLELAKFMQKLTESNSFLHQVWDMLVDANDHIHHAPTSFADALPALIGRPFALVSMGCSLELATQPMKDQTDSQLPAGGREVDDNLLEYQFGLKLGDRRSLHDGMVAFIPEDKEAQNDGRSRFSFDTMYSMYGLKGVQRKSRRRPQQQQESDTSPTSTLLPTPFTTVPASDTAAQAAIPVLSLQTSPAASVQPIGGSEAILNVSGTSSPASLAQAGTPSSSESSIPDIPFLPRAAMARTTSPATVWNSPMVEPTIIEPEYVRCKPYFVDPMQYDMNTIEDFSRAHNRHLKVFAAIIDPFQSVHGFSGILPTVTLKVPPWALGRALKSMGTFIRVGPLLIPGDLPQSVSTPTVSVPTRAAAEVDEAGADTTTGAVPKSTSTPATQSTQSQSTSTTSRSKTMGAVAATLPTVPVDSPSQGTWTWMQPVLQQTDNTIDAGSTGQSVSVPVYQQFRLAPVSREFAVPDGPQTALEGILQLQQISEGEAEDNK